MFIWKKTSKNVEKIFKEQQKQVLWKKFLKVYAHLWN